MAARQRAAFLSFGQGKIEWCSEENMYSGRSLLAGRQGTPGLLRDRYDHRPLDPGRLTKSGLFAYNLSVGYEIFSI